MKAATKFSFTGFRIEFDLILLLQQIGQQNETLFTVGHIMCHRWRLFPSVKPEKTPVYKADYRCCDTPVDLSSVFFMPPVLIRLV